MEVSRKPAQSRRMRLFFSKVRWNRTSPANIGRYGMPSMSVRGLLWLLLISAQMLLAALPSRAQDPATVGQWSAPQSWPFLAVHAHMLPTGKVLFWPSFDLGDNPQLWDPATNAVTAAVPAGFNIFCSGHSFLPNGQLLVAGGEISTNYGIASAAIYDPVSGSWTNLPNMSGARWYPTNTTLATGDVLVISGEISPTAGNYAMPEVWQTATSSWRELTGAQLILPLYPKMFLAPNGSVFYAGPSYNTRYLNTNNAGAWTSVARTLFSPRDYGPAVQYDDGKILLAGGGNPPTATTETIDLTASSPQWQYAAPMSVARRQHNATLLPDGTVFVSGGSSAPGFDDPSQQVLPTELWNPKTNTWTTLASLSVYRGYHSIAVLLPDGRVLSAGGRYASAEVFSPPYLFKGPRPVIQSAPTSVNPGQTFFVATNDAASINSVNWIAPSSVTHTFNMGQRINHLTFTQAPGGLNITAPASNNLAPPGPYMLFLINSNGVPSVASMVTFTTAASPPSVLSFNVASLSFAGRLLNTVSAPLTVSITNVSQGPVTINSIVANGDSFSIASHTCSTPLQPGRMCTVRVLFQPKLVGANTGTMVVNHSDPTSPSQIGLSGAGFGLKLSATSFAFSTQPVGVPTTYKASLTLSNVSTAPITINSLNFSSAEFNATNNCAITLAAGASCAPGITFTPSDAGPRNATLNISDTDPSSPSLVVLSGMGSNVQFSTKAVGYGSVATNVTSKPLPITLTNLGSSPLTISSVSVVGPNATEFNVSGNTCGGSVPAGTSCSFAVTFSPSALGTRTANLSVVNSDPASPHIVGLTGIGVPYLSSISLVPASPTITIGSASQLIANGNYSDGSVVNLTASAKWVSSNSNVLSVNNVSGSKGLIKGVAAGTASGSASFAGVTGTTQVTIQATSTTNLSSGANPSTYGQSVTFTAAVLPNSATGSVQFYDGSNLLGTTSLNSGAASFTTSSLAAGTHSLTAVYTGDTATAGSTSSALTQTVNQSATSTSLAADVNPSPFGQAVTFTASVSPPGASGTVQFFDGGTLLGSASLTGGTASFATDALTVGVHSMSAVYSSDNNFAASTSPTLMESVE